MYERVLIADVAQIYELWKRYADAASEGDTERWMALWVEDAIQMPPGAPTRVGRAEIQRAMRPLFERCRSRKVIIEPEEVRIMGDLAFAHGTYALEMAPEPGGETEKYFGKFLDILEKQVDGSWKIAIDCHNCSSTPEWGSCQLPT
jgi:uncharacterized protein (TIGR02246 family)